MCVDLVFGTLPVSIPNAVFDPAEPQMFLMAQPIVVVLFGGALAVLQFFVVHKMQGSPGKIVVGMKVQNNDGSRLSVWVSIFRSSPYLFAFCVMTTLRYIPENSAAFVGVGALVIVALGFALADNIWAIVTGSWLMDKVTGTSVIKMTTIPNDAR